MENAQVVVVLLGPSVEAGHVERAVGVLGGLGLAVERTEVLSGRPPGGSVAADVRGGRAGGPRRCRALALVAQGARAGGPEDLGAPHRSVRGREAAAVVLRLRRALRAVFDGAGVDAAVLPGDRWRHRRRLVCFDMDSTLVEAEVMDELARAAGVGEEVAAITDAAMRGRLEFAAAFRARLLRLAGLPVAALEEVARRLTLTPGAGRLLAALQRPGAGYRTAVVSGGFAWFARRVAERFGLRFDHVCAHELVVRDGRLTGEHEGEVIDGAAKAAFVRRLAAREGVALAEVAAAGDGANDVEMLRTAGLGVAFRPRPILRAEADHVHVLDNFGLDGMLYLLGLSDRDVDGG